MQTLNSALEGRFLTREEEHMSLIDLRRSTRERLAISKGKVCRAICVSVSDICSRLHIVETSFVLVGRNVLAKGLRV